MIPVRFEHEFETLWVALHQFVRHDRIDQVIGSYQREPYVTHQRVRVLRACLLVVLEPAQRHLEDLQLGEHVEPAVGEDLLEELIAEADKVVLLDDLAEVTEDEGERLLFDRGEVELLGEVVHVDAVRHRRQPHEVAAAQVDGLRHLEVCRRQQDVVDVLHGAAQRAAVGEVDDLLEPSQRHACQRHHVLVSLPHVQRQHRVEIIAAPGHHAAVHLDRLVVSDQTQVTQRVVLLKDLEARQQAFAVALTLQRLSHCITVAETEDSCLENHGVERTNVHVQPLQFQSHFACLFYEPHESLYPEHVELRGNMRANADKQGFLDKGFITTILTYPRIDKSINQKTQHYKCMTTTWE